MRTIRNKIFETNSSSTHAICIPKEVKADKYSLCEGLDHDYVFGREECRLVDNWDEKLAYIYIILKDYEGWTDKNRISVTKSDIKNFKNRVENIYSYLSDIVKHKPSKGDLRPKDIFENVDKNKNCYCCVDHTEDFGHNVFLERILKDKDFLMRFLFNTDSYITVGGDEYRGYNIKGIGFEDDFEEEEYYVNEKGEKPTKEWFDKDGNIKEEYLRKYWREYNVEAGGF